MDVVIFFGLLTVFYAVSFFFDRFFKSCMHYPYAAFLENTGISIDFLRVRLHTTAFNRVVVRWANCSISTRNFLSKCYTIGVALALLMLPLSLILVIVTIFSGGTADGHNKKSQYQDAHNAMTQSTMQLEILLPGVNLPLEEISYYLLTMLGAAFVHECGHAVAAMLEDVPVTGFGFQFYYCIPLAYTQLSMEHLNTLKWLRKLRILCAGILHNMLCAAFSYLILSSMGILLQPLYTLHENVIVTDVRQNSPLAAEKRGLLLHDVITHINNCPVHDKQTWYGCLVQALVQKPGYCVSSDFIRLNDESVEISQHHDAFGVLQCCNAHDEQLCCFEYIDDLSNDAPVEIPQHVCLHVRRTLTEAHSYCTSEGNCERGFCLRPLLHNRTTIMNFKRLERNSNNNNDVIYIGQPRDVARTIGISEFVPKRSFMSPKWGDMLQLFLQYNIVFNMGLGFINVIPCFGFDGYYIVKTIINSFLANRVGERPKRDFIATIITGVGTLLCILALIKIVWLNLLSFLFK